MSKEISTIISTGCGPLHLHRAAAAIKKGGINVKMIQGWVPKKMPEWLIDTIGKVAGRDHLSKRLKKRIPDELEFSDIYTCASSEFFTNLLFLLDRKNLISHDRAAFWGWKHFGRKSKRYLKKADVFHVRSGAGKGGAIELAKKRGMKIVVDHSIAHPYEMNKLLSPIYENYDLQTPYGKKDLFWSKCVLQDCLEADKLLVNSSYVKNTFVKHGYPEDRIEVIYLGIEKYFTGLKKNYEIQDELKLLFTGGFNFRKGVTVLFDALKILKKKDIKWRLDVYGSVQPDIRKQAEDIGNIFMHGHVLREELVKPLSQSDIYVFPSLAEGCANSAMEALAAGLPCILTPNAGTPARNDDSALIVPAFDAHAIADAIIRLKNNKTLRTKIGRQASKMIKQIYTWEDYAKKVKLLYTKVLND